MPPIVVPTLTVYNTQTGEVIGKMETKDNSSYFGFFAVKGNPGKIWVESSDGARADAMVEDSEFRSISEN
jgi:hypothetical protein